MPEHHFVLFGKTTLESIPISGGTLYRSNWTLEELPGPVINWLNLGRTSRRVSYLYKEHLDLLYARFRQRNPLGVSIEIDFGHESDYYPPGMSEEQVEELYEQRKIFVDLFLTDDDKGYPHLKKYLPELFEVSTLDRMERDPWLDIDLLGKAETDGYVIHKLENELSEDPRWSKEWRAYCDKNFGPRRLDYSWKYPRRT